MSNIPANSEVRFLRGGSGPEVFFGPQMVSKSYDTVRHGYSDTIACGSGEVCVRVAKGSPYNFAKYAVGAPAAVERWLREHSLTAEAETVAAASRPERTPVAKLANALQVPIDRIVSALAISELKVAQLP